MYVGATAAGAIHMRTVSTIYIYLPRPTPAGILLSTPPLNVQVLSVGGQSLAPHSGPEGTVLVATADLQSRLAWTTFSAPPALGTSARPEADSPSTGGGELGRGTAGDSGNAEEAECSASTGACSQVRFGWYSEYSIGYSQ